MSIMVNSKSYVGLPKGAYLSHLGVDVTCEDIDQNKLKGLKYGIFPIYKPGLEKIVKRNYKNERLNFSDDLCDAICGSEVAFIAVGTPSGEDGSADLKYVLSVADQIAKNKTDYLVVTTKSISPIGSTKKVRGVAMNPCVVFRDRNLNRSEMLYEAGFYYYGIEMGEKIIKKV